MAQKGYALNRMCYSFNSAENRADFRRDEEAYCRKYGLDEAQRAAVAHRNVLELIAAGGNIYFSRSSPASSASTCRTWARSRRA